MEFLDAVDRERGRTGVEQVTIIQGDTGQGYTKVAVSHLDLRELETERYTRVPGPGIIYRDSEQEPITGRKRRRLRKEGVEGVKCFKTGVPGNYWSLLLCKRLMRIVTI